ncbi:acyl-CoA dehydrogenase family protein [Nocardia vaccinii]|uniref:acyl-CoA dehydrogenase family protein n=1 Tax=Nocardia vaccinii TaxID=1822 RepID=UPI001FDF8891|nr:acyl-CoA dehydrogenase family protein [Nocardia vaccinii]
MTVDETKQTPEEMIERLTRQLLDEVAGANITDADKLGRQFDLGLAWVHQPIGLGGLGISANLQKIVNKELFSHGFPNMAPQNPIGYGLCAPTLMRHGTVEQQSRYLRPLFVGDEIWCQLFSEPGAGSDLASLSTRAEDCEGGWVVNGQKVWTTFAHRANLGLLMARTDPSVPKNKGITVFVVDMHAPGVDVRPLRLMTGDAEFNEVYLTDVRLSSDSRVGELNNGWQVARTTLSNERSALGRGQARRGTGPIGIALDAWSTHGDGDPVTRDRLMDLWVRAECTRLTKARASEAIKLGIPGPDGPAGKLRAAELNKAISEFIIDLLGAEGMLYSSYEMRQSDAVTGFNVDKSDDLQRFFLRCRANTIEGGTGEVLRTLVGERVLGLPAEPRLDRDVAWADMKRSQ